MEQSNNIQEVQEVKEEITEEAVNNVLKLKKATAINGEMVTEIPFDLESLNGTDLANAIKMLANHQIVVHMTEIDTNYHAAVFAVASGLDYSDITRLGAKDYTKACNIVRDFFLEE